MTIALSAVLILMVFLPGIIFRRSYLSSRFSISYIKTDIQSEVFYAFIPAVTILYIFNFDAFLREIGLSISQLGLFITGTNDIKLLPDILEKNFDKIICFNFKIWTLSLVLGHLTRSIVLYFGIDLLFSSLKFPNKWEYILTSQISLIDYLQVKKKKDYSENIKSKLLLILYGILQIKYLIRVSQCFWFIISLGKRRFLKTIDIVYLEVYYDKDILYSGVLFDYYLDSNGSLDSIILKYPSRKIFVRPSDKDAQFEDINLDFIILSYEHIHNITLRPINIEENKTLSQLKNILVF